MNYSQSANENATNSELDAKVIVKNVQLNSSQKVKLIEQYVNIFVDRMSVEDLELYVIDDVFNLLRYKNEIDLKKWISDDELYEELVENVLISELCEEVK